MALQIIKYVAADFESQPWRNGLGMTKELARDRTEPYRWRLSSAHLESSTAFSHFPGYERVILTLGHQTIWLLHGGGKKRMLPSLTPYTFSGDIDTHAEISAPVDDFNLFSLKDKASGKIYPTYFRSSREMQFPITGQEHFIYSVEGGLTLFEPNTHTEHSIKSGELLRVSRPDTKEYLNLKTVGKSQESVALWIVVHLK